MYKNKDLYVITKILSNMLQWNEHNEYNLIKAWSLPNIFIFKEDDGLCFYHTSKDIRNNLNCENIAELIPESSLISLKHI